MLLERLVTIVESYTDQTWAGGSARSSSVLIPSASASLADRRRPSVADRRGRFQAPDQGLCDVGPSASPRVTNVLVAPFVSLFGKPQSSSILELSVNATDSATPPVSGRGFRSDPQ